MTKTGEKLHAWVSLSRPPFHAVGILPFLLGATIAWCQKQHLRLDIFAWGVLGVILIMLATYYSGEYWDYNEDSLGARYGSSRFAGGSKVLQRGLLPRHAALWASLVSLILALSVGLVLQFGYSTGPLTILFGILGILGGFFYSTKPVRWVARGWGEVWIAFCYGWLPVAVGCYLQTGEITSLINWVSAPIGLTIFNVVLLNEFPDYDVDSGAGKSNLLVRLGRHRASLSYSLVAVASWVMMLFSIVQGVRLQVLWIYVPVLVVSLVLIVLVAQERWRSRATLEKLCGANLLVNLGTTAAFIFALVS